jgi:putative ABC transport system ATP-binding protein
VSAADPTLLCRGLSKTFNKELPESRPALDRIELRVEPGDFVVLIGGNGAGKSTLLNTIAGAVTPDQGSLAIAGRDITRLAPHKRAGLVTRVFQDPMIGTAAAMTIEENLAIAERRGRAHRARPLLTDKRRAQYRAWLEELGLGLEPPGHLGGPAVGRTAPSLVAADGRHIPTHAAAA